MTFFLTYSEIIEKGLTLSCMIPKLCIGKDKKETKIQNRSFHLVVAGQDNFMQPQCLVVLFAIHQ